jgi:hypothetical protein
MLHLNAVPVPPALAPRPRRVFEWGLHGNFAGDEDDSDDSDNHDREVSPERPRAEPRVPAIPLVEEACGSLKAGGGGAGVVREGGSRGICKRHKV